MSRTPVPTLGETELARLIEELARESRRFRFEVAPNPCVGAAVLAHGQVLARGYHEAWGGPHAEVNAFAAAEATGVPASEWDALVITLEPCSTHGKTPPCVERILKSGVKHVIVAELDPDRRHQGIGLRILQEHGVKVELWERLAPLSKVAPHFLAWTSQERLRRPRPWTIAKWAQTRSGQLVPPQGVGGGRWISSHAALEEVQRLRGRVDAIVTGVGTILTDDPRFTVRPPGDPSHPPLRVVLDSRLRTPANATIFRPPGPGEGGGPVHILCVAGTDPIRHGALLASGALVHELHAATDDGVNLREVQEWLWDRGARRVLVEAGPRLLTHYITAGFVDQLRIYTGAVNGGQGPTMAQRLMTMKLHDRLDREWGADAVLEAFVDPDRRP
ncbi:MAG: bifunctional diaminohydroxyphosphoribosylaminopyrimidine deaminase/5-amino-6-(5-phosphoribosylamino)uracil reductase RibD [Planctomycetes bacterium]|nr:bifunctional diaminohydroxyphosphoribosylaminopyrimidine deaminase/5-amino-6-(5-phosphoribosylamino)uracil reductase RibD [Planctomycetota bacterium]